MVKSDVTNISYEETKVVGLRNPTQVAAYITNGCRLLDVYVSAIDKKLVYVMSRAETYPYYLLWKEHHLNDEEE